MIVRQLVSLWATIRALLMTELDKTPQAIRNGAAVAACVAVAAAAIPAIGHRAAEQRADAVWAARAESMRKAMVAQLEAEANAEWGAQAPVVALPIVPVSLAASPAEEPMAYRARGVAPLATHFDDAHVLAIRASLRDQAALQGLSPFQPARLGAARKLQRERHCLSEAIYYEARGESYIGQAAVAEVVLNRVASPHYPDSICDVVYQGSWRSTGCQFTFTCDGSKAHTPRGEAWRRANVIAKQALLGIVQPITRNATHYHTRQVSPYWSVSLIETTRVGAHIFYRSPSRRERAALYAAAAPATPALAPVTPLGAALGEGADPSLAAATPVASS